jgi:hypothetical protein
MTYPHRCRTALACGFALIVGLVATPALADKRLAMVIGNSAYKNAPALKNPANDAADMAAALERLGFEVIRGLDLDYTGMRTMVRRFSEKLPNADVALLFYAGHGLQVAGKNYLVPVDAQIETQADLDFGTIDLDLVLRGMEADTRTNIIFLDACRDNPLAASLTRRLGTRSGTVSRGLAQVESSVGTLISFSTQPGNIALDGEGRNSPFTSALLKTIEIPGMPLSDVMIDVRNDVLRATARKQVPWDNSSLTGQFYFKPLPAGPPGAASAKQEGVEVTFWNSIKDSKNPQLFEAYLRRYPNGAFGDIARISLEQFKVAVAMPLAPALEQKRTISDPGLLREVHDRLYELNFDPKSPEPGGLKVAVAEFEGQSSLPRTGEVTQGLLTRLRDIGGLKPWGAIVYDKDAGKWGMAWSDPSRKNAVASARTQCGTAKCPAEISFFGTSCGAFALSSASWSIVSRDDIQKARQAALDECGKRGKACKIVGASCADGTGRSN